MVHRYAHMLFALTFFLGITYGLFGLIGARDSWDDLVTGLSERWQRLKEFRAGLGEMRVASLARSK